MRIGDLAGSGGKGLAAPEWGASAVVLDALDHTVDAVAAGLAFRLLDAASARPAGD